jgi:NADPH:quinone reductase-like Zn-dependent oxidoreductase
MRAVRFHEHGGADVLQVDEVERPDPGPDEVLLEVAGAGVNPVDTYFREGSYEPYGLPAIPGVDAAGEVVAVGGSVTDLAPGDVAYATGLSSDRPGGYAEYVAVPTDRVVRLPDGVDPVAAGGAGVVAVTAWRALVDHAGVEPAEDVLIHGGSGGVGHVAVQLARAVGARVVTTAAPAYHDEVEGLGAETVLDYARDDLADAVLAATDGGPDVIIDHRLDDYLQFDADVAATGGRVVGIGENDPGIGFERASDARAKDLEVTLMSTFNTPRLADPMARLALLFDRGDVRVEVARTYDLDAAGEAQHAVMDDSVLGKLVVTP